jgi:WD40 repeat protein
VTPDRISSASSAEVQARLRAWARAHAATAPRPREAPGRGGDQALPLLPADLAPRLALVLEGHEGGVHALDVGVTPDGMPLLATGSHDATVRVWNLVTGEPLCVFREHAGVVMGVRFLPWSDGALMLASVGGDGTLRIWDPVTGEVLSRVAANSNSSDMGVVLDFESRVILATLGADQVTRIWDPVAGACLRELPQISRPGSGSGIDLLAPEPGKCLAASGFDDGTLVIWDVQSGDLLHTIDAHSRGTLGGIILVVRFVPPLGELEPLVVTGSIDHTAKVWETSTAECRFTLTGHTKPVEGADALLLADGRRIVATASHDGTVRFWDADDGRCLHVLAVDSKPILWSVRFGVLADGTVLLVLGQGYEPSEHKVYVYALTEEPSTLSPAPTRLTASDASRSFAPAAGEWDIRERPEALLFQGHSAQVNSLASVVLDDGTALLASGSDDHTVRIWDLRSGRCLYVLEGHSGEIWGTAFAADPATGGALLATGARDEGGVRVWDALTGRLRKTLPSPDRSYAVALLTTPDGHMLVASAGKLPTGQSGVRLWDLEGEDAEYGLESESEIRGLALVRAAGDTTLVVAGGRAGMVEVADAAFRGCRALPSKESPDEPEGRVVVYSITTGTARDGSPVIVAIYSNSRVAIWDAATEQPLRTFQIDNVNSSVRHGMAVRMVRLRSGASLLAVISEDTASLWDPESGARYWSREELSAGARWGSPDPLAVSDTGDGLRVAVPAGNDIRVIALDVQAPWSDETSAASNGRDLTAWNAAVAGLPALAEAGIEPPLGLLADLVELTGGGDGPGRLAVLREHPGIDQLRALRWPAASRVALAALLLADAPPDPRFEAPQVSPGELYAALRQTLSQPVARPEPFTVPLAALRTASETVTAKTRALLEMLGAEAVAADPVLPLRMRQHEEALPTLSPRALSTLSDLPRQVTENIYAQAYSARSAAEVVGLHRHGSPDNLVRSQFALPDDIFTLRWASGDLLYRLFKGEPQPLIEAVTIVLDTTPPTFGPMEAVLRLSAHALAATLLKARLEPALVTLDQPRQADFIRKQIDLVRVWTTRTLQPPSLTPALATASAVGIPAIVVLTTHHVARDHPLTAGPSLRLLTTHAPGETPRTSLSPYHAHVGPRATTVEIVRAVAQVLSVGGGDR